MRQIIVAIETDDPKAHNETYSLLFHSLFWTYYTCDQYFS